VTGAAAVGGLIGLVGSHVRGVTGPRVTGLVATGVGVATLVTTGVDIAALGAAAPGGGFDVATLSAVGVRLGADRVVAFDRAVAAGIGVALTPLVAGVSAAAGRVR
jgi:hypothetical protein